jgi:hypothetical protein
MKYTLIGVWCGILLLLVGGAACALSPLYVDGGIFNWFSPAGENWIGYLTNIAFALLAGVLMFLGGVVLSVMTGVASSIIVVSKAKRQQNDMANDARDRFPQAGDEA